MLSSSDEIAGRGVMFLYVDDLAAERRRLQGLGIPLGDDIPGDYSTLAQLRDPDGNLITLATPPARPSRRHDRAGRVKRGMAPTNRMQRTALRVAADGER
jgi:hypothetical protein